MNIQEQFGRKLRAHRLERGLSQEELAEASGLHRTYISGLESGARNPTIKIVVQLAKSLGITASELLEGVDKP